MLDCFHSYRFFCIECGNRRSASEVTGVDASQLAVDQATENAKLNGLDDRGKIYYAEDVFELLPETGRRERKI